MARFDPFNFVAPIYDRLIKPTDPERMLKLSGLPISGLILDVGGGTGRISYGLRNWVTGIVIADSSMGMLAQAKRKIGLIPVCANSEQLSFPDECFERVIMGDALHHVNDHRATLAELWRVVKPGGRIVIEELDIQAMSTKIISFFERLIRMRSHFLTPLTIIGLFQFKDARTRLEREGSTAWIIVDKSSDAQDSSLRPG